MDKKGLKTLEFSKVIHILEQKAGTIIGKEIIQQLAPVNQINEVMHMQAETKEAMDVLRLKAGIPLGGIRDIRSYIKRVNIGGDLAADQLLEIANTIYAGRKVKRFILNLDKDHSVPILSNHADAITDLKQVEDEINACINEYGEIMDAASSELKGIRKQIRTLESRVKEKLDQILRNSSYQKMLQDVIVTIRNNRYVIPVKHEYRSVFGGMVHDQSASGATLFVEPEAVVQINNQLKEQRMKEEKEIEKILRELSNEVRAEAEALSINIENLGMIDFIQAKAELASEMKAIKPKLNDTGMIHLKKARHPLIPIDDVVPIDVLLGKEYSSIVITGPNTGGKTVSLKTIGLISLMAMAGLHIPAEEESEVAVFSDVYADIGDEQSIEQSLSTFSGHLTNIIRILDKMDRKSLILLDELGAGTDPTEGAALAVAILEKIRSQGIRVVATTHYSELKAYAYNREDVINASVEFDVQTLRPTYRLLIGVPGSSNAFAIVKRLGLSEDIIDFAKGQISEDDLKVESMIKSLELNQRTAEQDRMEAEKLKNEVEAIKQQLEKDIDSLDKEKEKIYDEARVRAEQLVEKAKKEAEIIIGDLRRLAMEEQAGIKEHKLIEAKRKLEEALPSGKKIMTKKSRRGEKIKLGDEVKVMSLGQKGFVIEQVDEKEFVVQIGIIKMKVARDDIQLIKEKKKDVKEVVLTGVKRDNTVRPEVDVRGNNVEDAIMKIDQYLDEAFMENYSQVSIIHGKGTGALRSGLQEFLRRHPHVKKTRVGQFGEGGTGVTVVELK